MKAIITGVAGFIGSHLADRLLSMGFKVVGIDNFSSGDPNNLSNAISSMSFKLVKADLISPQSWIEFFSDVDVVFHFAANPEVRHSFREPLDHYRNNVETTFNVLEACRRFGIRSLVFASSSTVYGDPEKIPTSEDHPINPISIYGATKAACEILCQTYSKLYGLNSLILRYANIVGPRTNHGVIIDFINKLKLNPYCLEILGDGTQTKSYLHIEDALDASIKAFDKFISDNCTFEVYNVGSMDQITVKDIANIIVSNMGLSGVKYVYKPITFDGRGWPGDVKIMLLDISKLSSKTSWKPKYSSIEAVERTVKHILNIAYI